MGEKVYRSELGVRVWGQLKGYELELVQKVEEIWSDRKSKPGLEMLRANDNEAS